MKLFAEFLFFIVSFFYLFHFVGFFLGPKIRILLISTGDIIKKMLQ